LQNGSLQILWGIGIVLLFLGVLLDLGTGNSVYGILGLGGVVLTIWWVALRGIALRAQRFLAARTKIMLSLVVITLGSVVLSLGIVLSVVAGNPSTISPFQLSGISIFMLGIAIYILSLALTKPGA